MKYPEFLKEGGTIGFVAPAFGCAQEPYKSAFNHSIELWKEKGYYVNLGPNVFCDNGIGISNTPELCGKELTEYYVNKDNDILLSCGGGELMCETLPYVDFEVVSKGSAKWFMGYSDNTNFAFMLTTMCDVASLYGPNAPSFGMKPWHKSLDEAYEVLCGKRLSVHNFDKYEEESLKSEENPFEPYNCTEDVCVRAFAPKKTDAGVMSTEDALYTCGVMSTTNTSFSGRIIGGCLDCLVTLVGTQFDYVNQFADKYSDDGIIWYLEACDLNVFGIRRAMWQLHQAGWFKHAKGFIIGRPGNGDDLFNLNRFDAVLPYTCAQYGVPVIMDADIGHKPPQMVMINGAIADVDYSDGRLTVDYRLE